MVALQTSWLVGSYLLPAGTEVTIDGSAQPITTLEAGKYLYHPTAALSLIDTVEDAMVSAGVAGASVAVLKNRKVQLSGGVNFTVTWSSTLVRDLLGFTGNLAGQSSYTAPNVSPLLWSPLKPENAQDAPLGVLGRPVKDTRFSVAPDGTTVATTRHRQQVNSFLWTHVPMDRYQTASELGGEYLTFWSYVLVNGYKFNLWRGILEDSASTSAVTWTTYLGPYTLRNSGRGALTVPFKRSQGLTFADLRADVDLDCLVTPEWDT